MIDERPVVVAIHPNLKDELDLRKEFFEDHTGKVKGGLTTVSEMAAIELKSIRQSGEKIKEIIKANTPKKYKFDIHGEIQEFVLNEDYKKLFILMSILNKKKDQQQINVDLSKLKGLKKNEVKFFW